MKLRNKKTGEIIDVYKGQILLHYNQGKKTIQFKSIEELEEWEDYEEPKEYWYIDDAGVIQIDQVLSSEINMRKSIGNYFETKEEAKKAVEKLKAWKRLKDAGFWFKSDSIKNGHKYEYILRLQCEEDKRFKTFKENEDLFNDLKLLFRGEE